MRAEIRLFPTGTYVVGPWTSDVIRVEGPGGPALNPRIRPHGHEELAAFLRAVLPLETGRLVESVLDSKPWEIQATPALFRGLGFDRDGWTLKPHGSGSLLLEREGGEARPAPKGLVLRSLELYARAILPVFEGLQPSPTGGGTRPGCAPPWVGVLRIGHRRLEDLLDGEIFAPAGD